MRSLNLFCQNSIPSFSALLPLLVRLILFTPTLTAEKGEREKATEWDRKRTRACEGGESEKWSQKLWGRMEVRRREEGSASARRVWENGKSEHQDWEGERVREWGQKEPERTWGRKVRSARAVHFHYSLASRSQPLQKCSKSAATMALLPKAKPSRRTSGWLFHMLFSLRSMQMLRAQKKRNRFYIFTPQKDEQVTLTC